MFFSTQICTNNKLIDYSQKIDTVVIETEMVFGGDTKDDPKTIMDTTVEDSMGDFNLTEVSITRGKTVP
jgi:hypothetical protein